MRSGTTAAAKDYMEVHEAMSSGSVILILSQKQKKYSNSRVREGRKGVAPFVRLICIDGESTARAAPSKMCSVSQNWFSVHFGSSGGSAAAAAVIYEN